jgi:hypothetical protein
MLRLSPTAETQIGDPYHRLGHATQMIHGPKSSRLQQPQRKRRGPRIDAQPRFARPLPTGGAHSLPTGGELEPPSPRLLTPRRSSKPHSTAAHERRSAAAVGEPRRGKVRRHGNRAVGRGTCARWSAAATVPPPATKELPQGNCAAGRTAAVGEPATPPGSRTPPPSPPPTRLPLSLCSDSDSHRPLLYHRRSCIASRCGRDLPPRQ